MTFDDNFMQIKQALAFSWHFNVVQEGQQCVCQMNVAFIYYFVLRRLCSPLNPCVQTLIDIMMIKDKIQNYINEYLINANYPSKHKNHKASAWVSQHSVTFVSSCAFAKLSTAMAKNTFKRVSGGIGCQGKQKKKKELTIKRLTKQKYHHNQSEITSVAIGQTVT